MTKSHKLFEVFYSILVKIMYQVVNMIQGIENSFFKIKAVDETPRHTILSVMHNNITI